MKKLFLSHKDKHPKLREFESVLRELMHVDPVLVEDHPEKRELTPPKRAEYFMKQCDGILFLLTKDTQSGNKWHPSNSVSMEITTAEQLFPKTRRFYMLELEVTFPTMAELPTYTSFSWNEMMPALVDLHKTLSAGKLIDNSGLRTEIDKPSTDLLFLVEAIANNPQSSIEELSVLYRQKFNGDFADFSVLINRMKSLEMLNEGSKVIHGDYGVLRKITVLSLSSSGLQFLGEYRDAERSRKAEITTKGLKALGLIK